MTNLLEIKPYIHDFVEENLDSSFTNKVYWLGEKRNIPDYPYCVLNVVAENKDKRTSRHKGNGNDIFETREGIITRYKTCTITISVYNGWTEDTTEENVDMDMAKEFAYEQADNLEGAFEEYPINSLFSIQNISSIRPLNEVIDGGYLYRYELDLTIGYNEATVNDKILGKSVNALIKSDDKDAIKFMVTIENNDNIIVET